MGGMWDMLKPALLMVSVQIVFSACNVLYKLAIFNGMSTIVIAAYRMAFAAITTILLALIFERKRPKMTWRVFILSLLSGLFIGTLFQNLFYGALVLASATLVSAIYNLIPSITFVLAVCFGLEKLNWGAATGKAKVTGTILGLAGALLLTFYKGVEFEIWPFEINLLDPTNNEVGPNELEPITESTSELLGVLCAVISCFAFSIWLIIQAKISEVYPCPQSSIALSSVLGTIQCVVFGFIVERDLNQWKLDLDIRLLTVAFSGIGASGIMVFVMAWVVQTKGPIYASAFNPLMLLIVALVASMILDEKLNLGSILGGVLIICGLYTVLWGKGRETKKSVQAPSETIPDFEDTTTPLLNP
ncbi:WAT1-related protein At1g25270-like [Vicia villosa]|uniref:WAT1-related protein At1g25270-like n=1 Tax=Vicia villosa TaxID=3911 RepID=UPI00273AC30C|nr:WAT1-related protein At1g25270-like [Vicia villosa]